MDGSFSLYFSQIFFPFLQMTSLTWWDGSQTFHLSTKLRFTSCERWSDIWLLLQQKEWTTTLLSKTAFFYRYICTIEGNSGWNQTPSISLLSHSPLMFFLPTSWVAGVGTVHCSLFICRRPSEITQRSGCIRNCWGIRGIRNTNHLLGWSRSTWLRRLRNEKTSTKMVKEPWAKVSNQKCSLREWEEEMENTVVNYPVELLVI